LRRCNSLFRGWRRRNYFLAALSRREPAARAAVSASESLALLAAFAVRAATEVSCAPLPVPWQQCEAGSARRRKETRRHRRFGPLAPHRYPGQQTPLQCPADQRFAERRMRAIGFRPRSPTRFPAPPEARPIRTVQRRLRRRARNVRATPRPVSTRFVVRIDQSRTASDPRQRVVIGCNGSQ